MRPQPALMNITGSREQIGVLSWALGIAEGAKLRLVT